MRFAISIPQRFADGKFDSVWLRDYLTRAESLGFHSAWTQEIVLGSEPTMAPLELMAYAAACTERLRLGCAVFVSPLHNPVHFAQSISTLDQLSHGRIEVGVGIGGKGKMYPAFEASPDHLVTRFTDGLQLMKACWTEPRITFENRFWQLDGVSVEPKPFQKPYPPLWIGAVHPPAIRRSVRYADGYFGAGSATTAHFAKQVQVLREALTEADRDPSTFQIAKRVYIVIDDDATRAWERANAEVKQLYGSQVAGLKLIYGTSDLSTIFIFGPPSACIAGVREIAEAGAELIQFHVFTDEFTDEAEQMERLATEVLSKVQ